MNQYGPANSGFTAVSDCDTTVHTFAYTGSDQSVVVPAGCTRVFVPAASASGGGATDGDGRTVQLNFSP